MTNNDNQMYELFNRMMSRGLVSTSNRWIEKASEQKNPRLTLDLACSILLVRDRLDEKLINISRLN
jgi:ubiquinone/menaquinone biosynthesis C-methylase UbiE